MDFKPLALAAAGAVVGVVGSNIVKSSAGQPMIDLMDPMHPNNASNQQWRQKATEFCEGFRAIREAQDRIHAASDIESVTTPGAGHYVLTIGTSAGPVSMDLRVPVQTKTVLDGGAGK